LLNAEQVADFLRNNPGVFALYPELLTQLQLPNPHGGQAVSIVERQVMALREKTHALETKLAELIRFGEENDQIGAKVHDLSCRLLAAQNLDTALDILYLTLLDHFTVPHVAVRLWNVAESGTSKEFLAVPDEVRAFTQAMQEPYCGNHPVYETGAWFGELAPSLKSFAMLPLRWKAEAFGVIVMASEDGNRFYPDMGTLYLTRIADLAAATMARYLTFIRESHATLE
jgi:uncharacterized protein